VETLPLSFPAATFTSPNPISRPTFIAHLPFDTLPVSVREKLSKSNHPRKPSGLGGAGWHDREDHSEKIRAGRNAEALLLKKGRNRRRRVIRVAPVAPGSKKLQVGAGQQKTTDRRRRRRVAKNRKSAPPAPDSEKSQTGAGHFAY
jgi:hypothetical protein